jgi:hypothetical protein
MFYLTVSIFAFVAWALNKGGSIPENCSSIQKRARPEPFPQFCGKEEKVVKVVGCEKVKGERLLLKQDVISKIERIIKPYGSKVDKDRLQAEKEKQQVDEEYCRDQAWLSDFEASCKQVVIPLMEEVGKVLKKNGHEFHIIFESPNERMTAETRKYFGFDIGYIVNKYIMFEFIPKGFERSDFASHDCHYFEGSPPCPFLFIGATLKKIEQRKYKKSIDLFRNVKQNYLEGPPEHIKCYSKENITHEEVEKQLLYFLNGVCRYYGRES